MREDGESGEWQDWLADEGWARRRRLAESEQSGDRHNPLWPRAHHPHRPRTPHIQARRLATSRPHWKKLPNKFGVSRERVRQIEVRAFEKIQKAVKTNIAHIENPQAAAAAAMH